VAGSQGLFSWRTFVSGLPLTAVYLGAQAVIALLVPFLPHVGSVEGLCCNNFEKNPRDVSTRLLTNSGCYPKQGGDEPGLSSSVPFIHSFDLSFSDHRHHARSHVTFATPSQRRRIPIRV
jgi:hypothetical protein